jgi:pyrroline-5-carboxylate reductase
LPNINAMTKLSLIGGGVMAEAILSCLLDKQIYTADRILVSEPQIQRRDFLADRYRIRVTDSNQEAIKEAEVVILAVKPQILTSMVANLKQEEINPQTAIVSILAGVTLDKLESLFPDRPIIRTMPNTPATVGAGMTAITAGRYVNSAQIQQAKTIFSAVGEVVEVPERLLDGVTGLSGSGPAYVAMLVEALSDGGVAAGLPRAVAYQLAIQTVLGTAQLLRDTGIHPAELKDRVTSPAGTTIAAVAELEKAGFRSAIIEAVKTAYRRSQELGN